MASCDQLDLSAPRSEAVAELARLVERRRAIELQLNSLDQEQRATAAEAAQASELVADLERRVAVGERVPGKERTALEDALAAARDRASQPWGERRRGLQAAVRDCDSEIHQFVSASFIELLGELEQDGEAAANEVDTACRSVIAAVHERSRCAQRIEALAQIVHGRRGFGDVAPTKSDALTREAERLLADGEPAPLLRDKLRGARPAADELVPASA